MRDETTRGAVARAPRFVGLISTQQPETVTWPPGPATVATHVPLVNEIVYALAPRPESTRHRRDALIDELQVRDSGGGVRPVVRVEGLHRRDRGANVGLCGALLCTRLEAEIRRHRNRQQDADDDEHHEELDQREAALLCVEATPSAEPLVDCCEHVVMLLSERGRGEPTNALSVGPPGRPTPQKGDLEGIGIPRSGGVRSTWATGLATASSGGRSPDQCAMHRRGSVDDRGRHRRPGCDGRKRAERFQRLERAQKGRSISPQGVGPSCR